MMERIMGWILDHIIFVIAALVVGAEDLTRQIASKKEAIRYDQRK